MMSINELNNALQLLIVSKDVVILLWLAYWSQRFTRSYRHANGITLAMALFFAALSLERLWLVVSSLYGLFFWEVDTVTLAFLGWRELSAWFVVASMGLIMWKFCYDEEHH